ncbi:MAG: T9SS type A sorting domain-containing protein [Bacteroidia bacterium]|nr:T9SS type A sorting domain-containing protein [Bacteroidia bacterium]
MRLLIILLFSSTILKAQSWVQLNDFPGTERDDGLAFVINNKAYCITGLEVGWHCTKNGYVLDGSTETWSVIASLPLGSERQYATGFSYNGLGYLLGGIDCSSICLNDFFEYSPSLNNWSQLPNFPGQGRQGMSNFIIKNKLYVLGGKYTDGTVTNEIWEYNFSNSNWTQKNNLPFNGMWRGSAFSIDTIGYVCYGLKNDNSYNHFMFKYNYINDTWSKISNIVLLDRKYIGTAICDQKACLYGGIDSLNNISNTVYVFNPIDSSIAIKLAIPSFARKDGMAFSLNNDFYYTTGVTNSFRTKETWKTSELVGLNEKIKHDFFKIYPNPASSVLNIVGNSNELQNSIIKLENYFGQIVFIAPFTQQIDISNLPVGIYFLTLKTDSIQKTAKVVKQ